MHNELSEFRQLAPSLARSRFGSFIVLPLKFAEEELNVDAIEAEMQCARITSLDMHENVKNRFAANGYRGMTGPDIGCIYKFPGDKVREKIGGGALRLSTDAAGENAFSITDSYLYLFHTNVAFMCLGVTFGKMSVLGEIINPGFQDNDSGFYAEQAGQWAEFDINKAMRDLYAAYGLQPFFSKDTFCFLEAYTYNICVMPERFKLLDTVRQISFNMHQMIDVDAPFVDESESDLRYVYSVKNYELDSYRWGCCVSSQTFSYAVAEPGLDIEKKMAAHAKGDFPMIVLALYEKYSCLHFENIIINSEFKSSKKIKQLKNMMLEFKAYGIIQPSNISRWDNIRKMFEYLLDVNETDRAIADISNKIDVLASYQAEKDASRNNTIAGVVTAFGLISIVASVLDIVQTLNSGSYLEWRVSILSALSILLIMVGISLYNRK